MDSKRGYTLDSPHAGGCPLWIRVLYYLHSFFELLGRRIRDLRSICNGCNQHVSVHAWSSFSTICSQKYVPSSQSINCGTDILWSTVYEELTIQWASSLLGFAAVAMTIIPYLFIRYGKLAKLHPHPTLAHKCFQGKKSGPIQSSVNSSWKGKGSRQKRTRPGSQQ